MSEPIYTLDLSSEHELDLRNKEEVYGLWEVIHCISCLQGLVNKDKPRLFLRVNSKVDDFWLSVMKEELDWPAGREYIELRDFREALSVFRDYYKGFVLYDLNVPATSNLASTICGVEKLLPLPFRKEKGSLCSLLEEKEFEDLPVKYLLNEDGTSIFTGKGTIPESTIPSTGSAKNDAYRWLIEKYILSGKVNPGRVGYYIDSFWCECAFAGWSVNHTLTNHDYVVSEGGVFFDLNVWDDEACVDEPDQPKGEDARTLRALFHALNEQTAEKEMIHVAGYVPWRYKYTNCHENGWHAGSQYGAVPAEWKCTEILSCFNAFLDADALDYSSMVNASFFKHFELAPILPQKAPVPTESSLIEEGILDASGEIIPRIYYAHFVGDYDSAAWLYWNLPEFWTDDRRGEVPLSWGYNPNLADRFGLGLHWVRQIATEKDLFVAGDSGAGYVNPRNLTVPRPYSNLDCGLKIWSEHCRKHFKQWDIDTIAFVLDGNCESMADEALDVYFELAPAGLVFHRYHEKCGLWKGQPFIAMDGDLPREAAKEGAKAILERVDGHDLPEFRCFRSVLMPPTWYADVDGLVKKELGEKVRAVDIRTLLYLIIRVYSEVDTIQSVGEKARK